MVPGRFFMVPGHFSWFQVGFHGFSWFQVGSSWFFMVFLQNVPARTVSWPDDPVYIMEKLHKGWGSVIDHL